MRLRSKKERMLCIICRFSLFMLLVGSTYPVTKERRRLKRIRLNCGWMIIPVIRQCFRFNQPLSINVNQILGFFQRILLK